MKRKGPVVRNTSRKNRHGTNCNDDSRVIVGMKPDDLLAYSHAVKQSVSNYILKYDLKCSLLNFPGRVNWDLLLTENKVSDEFIDAFANRVNWCIVCHKQELSEDFMNKHSGKVAWKIVSIYQKLSKKFILEHLDDLDMDIVMKNRFLITQEEIDEYKEQQKKLEKYNGPGGIEERYDILDL